MSEDRSYQITITVPKNEIHLADEFLSIYSPYVFQNSIEENRKEIKNKKNRICRFCGRKSGEVTFKKDAHIIPKSLGSKKCLYSEECDPCNKRFGEIEQNIATFLGTDRTIIPSSRNKKAPGFESANGNVQVKNHNGIITIFRNNLNDDFTFNDNNEFGIKMHTQKYIPNLFYKALLKIAMSIMPLADIAEYQAAINFLNGNDNFKYNELKRVFISRCSIGYEYPFAILFKRKEEKSTLDYPFHIFCLHVLNYAFEICFPIHNENLQQKNSSIQFLKAPYIILGDVDNEGITSEHYLDDFSSSKQQTKDVSVTMKINEESLKNAVALNLNDMTMKPVKFTKNINK